jgi:type IV pilus assembly protein PilM
MSHKVLYSKLFTPPKFLEMPAVCLEILPSGISFFLAKDTEKGHLPEMFGFVSLPVGAISQGEIIKKEAVIKALEEIKQKTRVGFARLSIPEEITYFFKTRLPVLESKEIRDILDFKIEENVPLTAKEAVFDYDIIPTPKTGHGLDLVVSVAPLKVIDEWQNILSSVGLVPVLFSPESNNVAKSVIKDNNQQVIVIANIRESSIVLKLVVYGIVCQTSSIAFGSSAFTDLLAKYFKVSAEEATKIKEEKLYVESAESGEIFSYLINTISAVKDEIYKFISYCNERADVDGQVDKVILCGRDALIVGLDKYLAHNLNIRVEVANVWVNNFDLNVYTPEISRLDSMDKATVNGLSLL